MESLGGDKCEYSPDDEEFFDSHLHNTYITKADISPLERKLFDKRVLKKRDGVNLQATLCSTDPKMYYNISQHSVMYNNFAVSEYEWFLLEYQKALNEGKKMSFLEKPEAYSGLRIDFDFKYLLSSTEMAKMRRAKSEKKVWPHIYTHDQIRMLVSSVQNVIEKCTPTQVNSIYSCILLEKTTPRLSVDKNNVEFVKDGFHLHFPKCIVESWLAENRIKPFVIKFMRESKIFESCLDACKMYNPNVDYTDIYDRGIMEKYWYLYGSSKTKKDEPYLATKLYSRVEVLPEDTVFSKFPQLKGFKRVACELDISDASKLSMALDSECGIDVDMYDSSRGISNDIRYFLPTILSVRMCNPCNKLRLNADLEKTQNEIRNAEFDKYNVMKKDIQIAKTKDPKVVFENLKLVTGSVNRFFISNDEYVEAMDKEMASGGAIESKGLIDFISPSRAENYDQWMDVGWTLYNIGGGDTAFLDVWKFFSQQAANKYSSDACNRAWEKMKPGNKTIRSLYAMAYSDNMPGFREWKDSLENDVVRKSLSGIKKTTESDVAYVVYSLYENRFICANSKTNTWFEFKNHRWVQLDDGITIRKIFFQELTEYYMQFSQKMRKLSSETSDGGNRKLYDEFVLKAECVAHDLKGVTFQEKLMKICKYMFHDESFYSKLDRNKMLFGCENGVLDLEAKIFREGRPDDYISKTCKVFYPVELTQENYMEDCRMKCVLTFLHQIFPIEELFEYDINLVSSCLEGGNKHKICSIRSGGSGGGKSVHMALLEAVFGDYMTTFPSEMLIRGNKPKSSEARPELANSQGTRIVKIQEISEQDVFDIRSLKELTGNDSMYVRSLYSNGGTFIPQFTLFICCNKPPKVDVSCEAVWVRLRILPYLSKFLLPREVTDTAFVPVCDEEREMFASQGKYFFHADDSITKMFSRIAPAYLWLLFDRYVKNKERNFTLQDSALVRKHTLSYRDDNNEYAKYVIARIEDEDKCSHDDFLSVEAVYNDYKIWYNQTHTMKNTSDTLDKVKIEVSKVIHQPAKKYKGRGVGWMQRRFQGMNSVESVLESESLIEKGKEADAKAAAEEASLSGDMNKRKDSPSTSDNAQKKQKTFEGIAIITASDDELDEMLSKKN